MCQRRCAGTQRPARPGHIQQVSFLESLAERAAARRRRILFPEAGDQRTLDAVRSLAREGVVEPVLLGRPATGAPACEVIDPTREALVAEVATELLRQRGEKGLTAAQADRLARDPLMIADALVHWGRADGCVAGAVNTSADVIRAAEILADILATREWDQPRFKTRAKVT